MLIVGAYLTWFGLNCLSIFLINKFDQSRCNWEHGAAFEGVVMMGVYLISLSILFWLVSVVGIVLVSL